MFPCVSISVGAEPGVAEHGLDVPDVRPAFEHERRHRVPEVVATAALPHHAFFDVGGNEIADAVARDALTVGAGKNNAGDLPGLQLGAGVFELTAQPLRGATTERGLSSTGRSAGVCRRRNGPELVEELARRVPLVD